MTWRRAKARYTSAIHKSLASKSSSAWQLASYGYPINAAIDVDLPGDGSCERQVAHVLAPQSPDAHRAFARLNLGRESLEQGLVERLQRGIGVDRQIDCAALEDRVSRRERIERRGAT